jgi:hypothetical protein
MQGESNRSRIEDPKARLGLLWLVPIELAEAAFPPTTMLSTPPSPQMSVLFAKKYIVGKPFFGAFYPVYFHRDFRKFVLPHLTRVEKVPQLGK